MIAITGIERTVLLTPNAHGTDNSVIYDALVEVGDRFRGLAKIDDNTTDEELEQLNRVGFRGARFNCIDALVAVAPDRLLWGTDWPHGNTFTPGQIPNDGDLVDLVARFAPDEPLRHKIFVDNPARLFGWD